MSHTTHSYVAVVDDDESLGRSVSRLLRAVGYQPIVYRSADDLLADANQPGFDCVLLDVQLEGMSGIELGRQLIAAGSAAAVIFITAHDDPLERDIALQIPGAAYLSKSEPAETVLAVIRRAIASKGASTSAI